VLVDSAGLPLIVDGVDTFMCSPDEIRTASYVDVARAPDLDDVLRAQQAKNALMTARVAWRPRFYDPQLAKWLHRCSFQRSSSGAPAMQSSRPPSRGFCRGHSWRAHAPYPEYRSPSARRSPAGFCCRRRRLHRRSSLVKFIAFHLMPYADLDLSYSEKYDSRG